MHRGEFDGGGGDFSAAAGYSKMEAAEAAEVQAPLDRTETMEAMHSLLAGIPEDQRYGYAYGISGDSRYEIFNALDISDQVNAKSDQELRDDLSELVKAVGGPERAQKFLIYPGLTADEELDKVRPVRDDWADIYLEGNKIGPQTNVVMSVLTGHQMAHDIAEGGATWEDVAYGYLTRDQIETQKAEAAKFHKAFRAKPGMPSGHHHPDKSHTIPNARFGHLQRLFATQVVNSAQTAARWAYEVEGEPEPPAVAAGNSHRATKVDSRAADELNEFFSNPRFKPYVDTLLGMYDAAAKVITSEEGRELLSQHRRSRSTRLPDGSGDAGAIDDLTNLMQDEVRNYLDDLKASGTAPKLPTNLDSVFVDTAKYCGYFAFEY